jgi:hypothetical protein
MARFRKGTTDHDGDGRKGGSLRAGSRFVKGTTDPDNDGNRGGSLPKGDDMAKAATRKTAAKATALKRTRTAAMTSGDKAPEAQPKLAERKEAAAEQFATADATAAAEARLRLAVRGF